MAHTMAPPSGRAFPWEIPAWKGIAGAVCAVVLGLAFIVAGVWKVTDPYGAAARFTQLLIPGQLSLPAAVLLGIAETFSGVLLLIPRFRRWGAWTTAALLVAFMVYIGANYNRLLGEECSCFPWLKRGVGPGFFVGDAAMLLAALAAGFWSRKSENLRTAVMILGAVMVFAVASFGVNAARLTGKEAPASITVDGKPYSLQAGRVLIYFFDPECSHCDAAARTMSKYAWNDVRVVVVPTRMPQFSGQFLNDTRLKAVISNDVDLLKKEFPFGDPPYGVAIENGRQKAALIHFDDKHPEAALRELGFVK